MILRREAEKVGLTRSFVIYDDADQLQLVKRAMREERRRPGAQPARGAPPHRRRRRTPAGCPTTWSAVAGRLPRPRRRSASTAPTSGCCARRTRWTSATCCCCWSSCSASDPETLAKYRRRFQHVLVDEFQDTNPVQYELLQLLAPPPASNLVVVGDDDQSIYRWRGAEVDNILQLPRRTTAARKVVKLEQNYRSRPEHPRRGATRSSPRTRGGCRRSSGPSGPRASRCTLLITRDERERGAGGRPADPRARTARASSRYQQMAVFYRANAQSRVLEEALRLARVPYTLVSGRSFYERAEVKDAAAYLRLMVNPRSDADLLRVINTPARGIGDTTVERLSDLRRRAGRQPLRGARTRSESISSLNRRRRRSGSRGFRALLEPLVQFAARRRRTRRARGADAPGDPAGRVADRGRGHRRGARRARRTSASSSAPRRSSTCQRAAAAAAGAAEALDGRRHPPLQAFLEQISLVAEADAEVGEGRVSLMTLHAAKGLEFDAVFLTGMEDGVFPHQRALDEDGDEEEMGEERRLCYVGFTRARKRLLRLAGPGPVALRRAAVQPAVALPRARCRRSCSTSSPSCRVAAPRAVLRTRRAPATARRHRPTHRPELRPGGGVHGGRLGRRDARPPRAVRRGRGDGLRRLGTQRQAHGAVPLRWA